MNAADRNGHRQRAQIHGGTGAEPLKRENNIKHPKQTIGGILAALALIAVTPASAITKVELNANKDQSKAEYNAALDRCKGLAGNSKDVCQAEAKATRTKADAMTDANYKNTPKARADALDASADADYDVAKERCDAKAGNEKDVCIKEAKAVQVRAKADAKVSLKGSVARNDAADDKRSADYKVALEKCDGLAGAAKDNCQKDAKATYRQ